MNNFEIETRRRPSSGNKEHDISKLLQLPTVLHAGASPCLSVRLSRYVSCLLIGFSVIPLHFHFGFLLSLFCFKQLYFVFTVCLFMSLVHEYVSNSLMYIYHKKRKHTEKIYACDRICFIVYVCVCLCMCMYVCVLMCICVCVGMSIWVCMVVCMHICGFYVWRM